MAFNNVSNQLQYIAKNGNYPDLANAMALLSAYSSTYTTGKVNSVKRLRGGTQASAVANLESFLIGAVSQTNSIQEFNTARDTFFEYIAATNSAFYSLINVELLPRLAVFTIPIFPINVEDCQGTVIGSAIDLNTYLTLWNDSKVDADRAICGTATNYIFDTGVPGYLGMSKIQPDNTKIHYNAPASTKHHQLREMDANRKGLVDREAEVKPQAIAKYSNNNI